MRMAPALRILVAALVVAGANVAPASAQSGGGFFPWLFQSQPAPPPPAQPVPQPQLPQRVRIAPRQQVQPNPTPLAPVMRRAAPRPRTVQEARPGTRLDLPAVRSAAVAAREAPAKPKVEPTSFVHVMGDSLAELLGEGLDEVKC